MFWLHDRARRLTLGRYGSISLAEARVKYTEAKKAVEDGRDPAADKVEHNRAERDAETVAELVELYLAKWARPRKRSAHEDERILYKDVVPIWGKRRAKDIRRRDVIALLDAIVERGAPIQANRTLACVRKMFNWAVKRDLLDASPSVQIDRPADENIRDRALSDEEVKTFWNGLEKGAMTASIRLALKLQLVTGQRRGEILSAEWSEIDIEDKVWTIPAEKAKNNLLHAVPLSPLALKILGTIKRDGGESGLVFPSPRKKDCPITGRAVTNAVRHNLHLIGVFDVTPHDLRRTAATQLSKLGTSRVVLSQILNHMDKSVTARYDTHRYLPEKRAALDRWAAHLEAVISGEATPSNVVELKPSAR